VHVGGDARVKECKPSFAINKQSALTSLGFHGLNAQSKCVIVLDKWSIQFAIAIYQCALNEYVPGIFWLHRTPRDATARHDGEFAKLHALPGSNLTSGTHPVRL
jgi:hypothetical protein